MTWMDDDIATLRGEYAEGKIGIGELEDGLDDVFGINGGIGHAMGCLITHPSGVCTCPKDKPKCPRSHRPWRVWIEGREFCYACNEWEPVLRGPLEHLPVPRWRRLLNLCEQGSRNVARQPDDRN